ncbi:MAG TPA: hypothetical protein DDZ97_12450 [Deltaproteobacteria bacterium]|jgi:hypothetical protein|nr:MAG: hypothetical protein EVA80_10095 [Pseudomonadota bacterium]HBM53901.1 hypothetical protein [Deltaproteobacteria bacterium]|tara:strand:- start:3598 stop:3822 length:225 start_codon:yes stop_codon:yes gene_type:complete
MNVDVFAETRLQEMIEFQREKLLKLAREILPDVTPEDLRNPQDFPDLVKDPLFNYEDGLLAGYLAVQIAMRSRL